MKSHTGTQIMSSYQDLTKGRQHQNGFIVISFENELINDLVDRCV